VLFKACLILNNINIKDYIEKLTKNTRFYDTLLDYAELLGYIDTGHENDNDDDQSKDTEEFDNREIGISDDKLRRIENTKKRMSVNQSQRINKIFCIRLPTVKEKGDYVETI
ncbi:unnamed protein product, partial [Didymodactylos carnosus]